MATVLAACGITMTCKRSTSGRQDQHICQILHAYGAAPRDPRPTLAPPGLTSPDCKAMRSYEAKIPTINLGPLANWLRRDIIAPDTYSWRRIRSGPSCCTM